MRDGGRVVGWELGGIRRRRFALKKIADEGAHTRKSATHKHKTHNAQAHKQTHARTTRPRSIRPQRTTANIRVPSLLLFAPAKK